MSLGPPKDVEATELFLKLLEPSPSEVVPFPRKGADGKPIDNIRVQVLPSEKHDEARFSAYDFLKQKGYTLEEIKSDALRAVVNDRIAKELLAMACLTAKSQGTDDVSGKDFYGRIFVDGDQVGKLRAQELSALYSAYLMVQAKYGPYEYQIDVNAWVKRLVEGGQAFPLLSMDLPEHASLTSSLSARLHFIFGVLESQWTQLPDTCRSALGKFNLGTGYWSKPLSNSDLETTENFDEIEVDDMTELSRKLEAEEKLRDQLE